MASTDKDAPPTDNYLEWIRQKSEQFGNHEIKVTNMKERKACWNQRDQYYRCFDDANSRDFPTVYSRLEKCSSEIERMYQVCPVSWSENFTKKYIMQRLGLANTRPNTITQQKPVDQVEQMANLKALRESQLSKD